MDSEKQHNDLENDRTKPWFSPRAVSSRRYLWVLGVFVAVGVLGGYAYYALIGCKTGSCAITSNPYMSMAWGGILGYLLPDFFVRKQKEE